MSANAEELARLIQDGLATEDDKGVVLRAIQIGLGSSLAAQIRSLGEIVNKEIELYGELQKRYEQLLSRELNDPAMTANKVGIQADMLFNRIHKAMDLSRQVVQGKNLFPQDTLSASDRKVLQVLTSIKSEDEKKRFFSMLDHYLNIDEITDYEEIKS